MSEYIEREALMKNFCGFDLTECAKYGNKTKEQASRSFETLMMYEIADVVEDAPAADVAPVVHGKVTRIVDDAPYCELGICNICGAYIQAWNYCPNCGAKMDTE